MDQKRIEEIKARESKATEGPWFHKEGILKHYIFSANLDLGFSLQELHPDDGREWATAATADFITHARQDIPDLVTYVEWLRAEVERLKEEVDLAKGEALDACDRRNLAYDEVERLKVELGKPKFYRVLENYSGQTINLVPDPAGIVTYQEITEAEYLEYKALWEEENN